MSAGCEMPFSSPVEGMFVPFISQFQEEDEPVSLTDARRQLDRVTRIIVSQKPLLHVIVLYAGDEEVRAYAEDVRDDFLKNRINVFLQVQTFPKQYIKPEHLVDIINRSDAECLVVVGDRNMKNRSLQVRLNEKLYEKALDETRNNIHVVTSKREQESDVFSLSSFQLQPEHYDKMACLFVPSLKNMMEKIRKIVRGFDVFRQSLQTQKTGEDEQKRKHVLLQRMVTVQEGLIKWHKRMLELVINVKKIHVNNPARHQEGESGGPLRRGIDVSSKGLKLGLASHVKSGLVLEFEKRIGMIEKFGKEISGILPQECKNIWSPYLENHLKPSHNVDEDDGVKREHQGINNDLMDAPAPDEDMMLFRFFDEDLVSDGFRVPGETPRHFVPSDGLSDIPEGMRKDLDSDDRVKLNSGVRGGMRKVDGMRKTGKDDGYGRKVDWSSDLGMGKKWPQQSQGGGISLESSFGMSQGQGGESMNRFSGSMSVPSPKRNNPPRYQNFYAGRGQGVGSTRTTSHYQTQYQRNPVQNFGGMGRTGGGGGGGGGNMSYVPARFQKPRVFYDRFGNQVSSSRSAPVTPNDYQQYLDGNKGKKYVPQGGIGSNMRTQGGGYGQSFGRNVMGGGGGGGGAKWGAPSLDRTTDSGKWIRKRPDAQPTSGGSGPGFLGYPSSDSREHSSNEFSSLRKKTLSSVVDDGPPAFLDLQLPDSGNGKPVFGIGSNGRNLKKPGDVLGVLASGSPEGSGLSQRMPMKEGEKDVSIVVEEEIKKDTDTPKSTSTSHSHGENVTISISCSVCGSRRVEFECSSCSDLRMKGVNIPSTFYCSTECQTKNFKTHKEFHKKLSERYNYLMK